MATRPDQDPELERLRKMPIRSEEIGFSPEEMAACVKCGKPNAPNRTACLYCGSIFQGAATTKLNARELENWEKGFNVVITDAGNADVARTAAEVSSLLGTAPESLKDILRSGRRVPLARLESRDQAATLAAKLASFGIDTRVIDDESLQPDSRPVRLRSIVFDRDELRMLSFNPGYDRSLARADVALIAVGVILEERTESVERRKRRAKETLSEYQLSFDEGVIDIYSRRDPSGWRIPATGFDYSCLGPDKALLAGENMRRLVTRLAEFSPDAKVVDDYADVRSLLEYCWPGESRRDARRVGRKDVESIILTSNSGQWTKYSRLQWHLL